MDDWKEKFRSQWQELYRLYAEPRTLAIIPKERPRWYQLRWKLANALIRLARWISPVNPSLHAWTAEAIMDQMVYGQHIVRVDPFSDEAREVTHQEQKED